MINSVAFKGLQSNSSLKDLYSAPQRFQRTTPYEPNAPEKKKSGAGKKIAIGAAVVAAIATALALLATKGKLDPKVLAADAGKLAKGVEAAKAALKTAGTWIADNAMKVVDGVKNLFAKKGAAATPPVA